MNKQRVHRAGQFLELSCDWHRPAELCEKTFQAFCKDARRLHKAYRRTRPDTLKTAGILVGRTQVRVCVRYATVSVPQGTIALIRRKLEGLSESIVVEKVARYANAPLYWVNDEADLAVHAVVLLLKWHFPEIEIVSPSDVGRWIRAYEFIIEALEGRRWTGDERKGLEAYQELGGDVLAQMVRARVPE